MLILLMSGMCEEILPIALCSPLSTMHHDRRTLGIRKEWVFAMRWDSLPAPKRQRAGYDRIHRRLRT